MGDVTFAAVFAASRSTESQYNVHVNRFRQRILNVAGILSILLFALVAVMWPITSVQSKSHGLWYNQQTATSGNAFEASIGNGSVYLVWIHQWAMLKQNRGPWGWRLTTYPADRKWFFSRLFDTYRQPGPVASFNRIQIANWAICFLTAAIAFSSLILRKRLAPNPGSCPSCGYDLRATPYRCPECGAIPPANNIISS